MRRFVPMSCIVALALFATAPRLHADAVYTFSRTGSNPYNFSFTLPTILTTTTPDLELPPLVTPFFVLSDSALFVGESYCFSFATGSGDARVTDSSCGFSIPSGALGLIAVFSNANAPGTYLPFASSGSHSDLTITQLVIEETSVAIPEPPSSALIGMGAAGVLAYLFGHRSRWRK